MASRRIHTYTFTVEPEMFRRTLYFDTFGKRRFQSVVMVGMFVLGLCLCMANLIAHIEMTNVMQICYIVLLAALPLMVFSCETGYRRYRSSPLCSKMRTISLSDDWLKFLVVGGADSEKVEWRLISAVFELDDRFVIYRDAGLMVLLPKTAVPDDDLDSLRALFARSLGRSFRIRRSGIMPERVV